MLLAIADIVVLNIVRSLTWMVAILPERYGFKLARFFVSIILLAIPRSHKVALRNTELIFPQKSKEEREEIVRRSYDVLAQNLLDFAQLKSLPKKIDQFDFRSCKEAIEKLRRENPGVGILAPTIHYGSFELIVQVQSLLDRPVGVLARKLELPRLDRWWNGRREMYGSEIFDRKGGYKEIVRRLKMGQDVPVLFDQNVKANHAMFVSFFGIQAATTKSIALAALRTDAPVLFMTSARIKQNDKTEMKFFTAEIPKPSTFSGSKDEQMLAFTEAIHREIEKVIIAHPEQWFWIHRRFKTRPNGEKSLY